MFEDGVFSRSLHIPEPPLNIYYTNLHYFAMPSSLVRADQVLMNYLTKKADESESDWVSIQTVYEDIQSVQNNTEATLYEVFGQNGQLQSPELNKELTQLESMKKIEIEGGSIRPLGIGRISGGALQLHDEVKEAINSTTDRKTTSPDK